MSVPTHRTSRPKEAPGGDEEATSQLVLGEFENVPTLSLSEARILITTVVSSRMAQGRDVTESENIKNTVQYLEIFARFKQRETIEAVERVLKAQVKLEPFERSQIGSLCCETAEEAKTLIPSLQDKISEQELQEVLDEITKLRNEVE